MSSMRSKIESYIDMLRASLDDPYILAAAEACDNINCTFTENDAREWCSKMKNADGSVGGHWSIEQTDSLNHNDNIPGYMYNAVMNMMYSDYYPIARNYGNNEVKFYKEMADAFLEDIDAKSPEKKVAAYYHHIAEA